MCDCKERKDACVRCGKPMPGTTNFHCLQCIEVERQLENYAKQLEEGTRVIKQQGDYWFEGVIVGIITKRNGTTRYVVEDDRGLLLILNRKQLEVV